MSKVIEAAARIETYNGSDDAAAWSEVHSGHIGLIGADVLAAEAYMVIAFSAGTPSAF